MEVETYEVTETTSAGVESDESAIALIRQLGLTGQATLIKEAKDGASARNPYRHMTADEERVYDVLMPQKVKIQEYNLGPIPLRVLQVAAHARDLGLPTLWVWCPEGGPKDDPLLVADGRGWNDPKWLLARWGDCLLPFDELTKRACVVARDRMRGALSKVLHRVTADLASLDSWAPEDLLEKAKSPPAPPF